MNSIRLMILTRISTVWGPLTRFSSKTCTNCSPKFAGLTPDEANKKLKHIARVWNKNLKADEKRIMIKNAKTITLVASFPNRRIQVKNYLYIPKVQLFAK